MTQDELKQCQATARTVVANAKATPGSFGDILQLMLTHEAENGTNTPTLLARSRHASVRSPERYARAGPEAPCAAGRRKPGQP